jgi:hypothetical protein
MANPNLLAATSALGNTVIVTPANSVSTTLLANAASSGQVFKINRVGITNNSGGAAVCQLTIGSSTVFTASVAGSSTQIAIDKNNGIYLLENITLNCYSNANSTNFVVSYEIIS